MSGTAYRSELSRIYDLLDLTEDLDSPNAYFRRFGKTTAENPVKKKHFLDIERDLQGLDQVAWNHLKKDVKPLLEKKHCTRGWQGLFDKLNQAKAYNHLVSIRCTNVRFVPESKQPRQKTPDLEGTRGVQRVLCEVKTVNPSEEEVEDRNLELSVRNPQDLLNEKFFAKLTSILDRARAQLAACDSQEITKKLIFIVLNYDDRLHEYAENYSRQLGEFLEKSKVRDSEIVLYAKLPGYSATALGSV
jgi:hypothetical protein